MCKLFVRNVGHGFCMAVDAPCAEKGFYLDCGSRDNAQWAAREFIQLLDSVSRPDAFVLSHFHYDHYNGLLWLAEQSGYQQVSIKTAYYPRIPDVLGRSDLRTELLIRMIAFNCYLASRSSNRILGNTDRSIQLHFAEVIKKVGGCRSGCYGVAQNDFIQGRDGISNVLWPPRVVEDGSPYGKEIKKSIDAFNEAAEIDNELRKIHETVLEAGVINLYNQPFSKDEYTSDDHPNETRVPRDKDDMDYQPSSADLERENQQEEVELDILDKTLSVPIKKVNQAMRNVADLFSLAVRCEPHILILGDLRQREIQQIVQQCVDDKTSRFQILVSSHHGTRWHDSIKKLSFKLAVVSSNGVKQEKFVNQEYGMLGVPHVETRKEGNFTLPM